jgi:hypothetical protein
MANVTAGYNWVSGETVTPAKLNSAAAPTVVVADNEITTAKILDANVTAAKLASNAVETAKILDANVTPAKLSQPLTLATSVATTSGTSIDFTGIPSWAKRITVMFNGVSTNGSSVVVVQIGDSGGIESSGYVGIAANQGTTGATYANLSLGFATMQQAGASIVFFGQMILTTMGSNNWMATGSVGRTDAEFLGSTQGAKTLSGTLDRIRLTTVNGTDTFDAGSVNILYEG